jgi:hypothetical protein
MLHRHWRSVRPLEDPSVFTEGPTLTETPAVGVQLDTDTPTLSNCVLLFIFVKEESEITASIYLSWQQNAFRQYGSFNNNANYKHIFRLHWWVWSYYIQASLYKPRPTFMRNPLNWGPQILLDLIYNVKGSVLWIVAQAVSKNTEPSIFMINLFLWGSWGPKERVWRAEIFMVDTSINPLSTI